jgi:hypothetical protein
LDSSWSRTRSSRTKRSGRGGRVCGWASCQWAASSRRELNHSRQSGHGRVCRIVIRCSLVLTVGCRLRRGRHEPTPAATVNLMELNGDLSV